MENHDVKFNLTTTGALIRRTVAQIGQVPMLLSLRSVRFSLTALVLEGVAPHALTSPE